MDDCILGLYSGKPVHARDCDEPDRRDDRGSAHAWRACGASWLAACLILALSVSLAAAERVRIVSFNTDLARKGPGLLVRDLLRGDAPDLEAVLDEIVALRPDILVLQSLDYDADGVALRLISERLAAEQIDLPYHFAKLPNAGRPTPFDLDRNGRRGQARDKQGFGFFHGNGGIGLLSRFEIQADAIRDFTGFLWRDLPGARPPRSQNRNYFTTQEWNSLRLHSIGAWDVPIRIGGTDLHLLISHASPPVFDGPENRNGLRNGDEIRFWLEYLSGHIVEDVPQRVVLAATLNADPERGEGDHAAIRALLTTPVLVDPEPQSDGARAASGPEAAAATVDWPERSNGAPGPGNLRVDYLLPSPNLALLSTGVAWPAGRASESFGSSHRPVWLDISLPGLTSP